MLGRDDGQVFAQTLFSDAVEVVAVVVREYAEVYRRELFDFERGVGQALGGQAVTEMHVVARVQKIRVCQNREAGVAQQNRRRADEEYRALTEVCFRAFVRRQT